MIKLRFFIDDNTSTSFPTHTSQPMFWHDIKLTKPNKTKPQGIIIWTLRYCSSQKVAANEIFPYMRIVEEFCINHTVQFKTSNIKITQLLALIEILQHTHTHTHTQRPCNDGFLSLTMDI